MLSLPTAWELNAQLPLFLQFCLLSRLIYNLLLLPGHNLLSTIFIATLLFIFFIAFFCFFSTKILNSVFFLPIHYTYSFPYFLILSHFMVVLCVYSQNKNSKLRKTRNSTCVIVEEASSWFPWLKSMDEHCRRTGVSETFAIDFNETMTSLCIIINLI